MVSNMLLCFLIQSSRIHKTFALQEEKQLLREVKLPNITQLVDFSYLLKKILFTPEPMVSITELYSPFEVTAISSSHNTTPGVGFFSGMWLIDKWWDEYIVMCSIWLCIKRLWHEIPAFTKGGVWNWLVCRGSELLIWTYHPRVTRCCSRIHSAPIVKRSSQEVMGSELGLLLLILFLENEKINVLSRFIFDCVC